MAEYFGDQMDQHGHSSLSRITAHQSRITDVEQGGANVVADGVDQKSFPRSVRTG